MGDSIGNIYKLYRHPIGSLVTFDATGIGINLNADIIVTPYLVRFNNRSYPFPLFKKISIDCVINNVLLLKTSLISLK